VEKHEYSRLDATALAELVARKEVTPTELLDTALGLVSDLNPSLNAVVHIREQVARKSIADGLPDGPFSGVPFLIKDLGVEAKDFPTSNGSKLTEGMVWGYDSEMYTRFKASGAVTFARTTSPEFGVGPVTEAGVYGGPTRNPWNLDRTSGGSSGGSGAATAAGIVPMSHASDGGGSVRIPASSCGLVGFKLTRAQLPNGPASGEGWGGMAINGVLSRSLRDSVTMLDAVKGADLGAPYCAPPLSGTLSNAMITDPGKLRIRYSTSNFMGGVADPECVEAVTKTARSLADLGHEVEEFRGEDALGISAMMFAWTKIVASGTALTVRKILAGKPLDPEMVDGVTRGAVAYSEQISGADYLEALNEVHAFGRRMARVFLDCDVLLTPTLAEPPIKVGRLKPDNEDFVDYRNGPNGVFAYSPYCAIFNASGQPAVSLPLHWSKDNLPVGVHLAMAFGEDERLISLAAQIEQAMPWEADQLRLIDKGGIWR